ncbi:unnamed protein product [[Candida] boidinii]|nr:unnamed protein product [[Candida] boidinii]
MKDNNLTSVTSANTLVGTEDNYYTVDQLRYLPTPKEFTNFEELMNSDIVRDVLKSSLKAKKYHYLRNLSDSLNEASRSRYSHKLKQLEEGDTVSSSAASTGWRTIKSNPSTMLPQKVYPPNSNIPYRTNTLVSGMSFNSNVSSSSTISSHTQLSYHSKWSDASDRSDNSDVHPVLSSSSIMLVDDFLARLESNLKQFPIFDKRADKYNIIRALPILSEKFKSGYTVFPSTSALQKYKTYNTFMDKSLKVIRDIKKKNDLAIKQYNKKAKTKDETIIEKSELARIEKFNNIENDIKFIRELNLLKPLFKCKS